jgi:hypothetical protein
MRKIIVLFLALSAMLFMLNGCKSDPGNREFVPGKGWRPV